MTLVTVYSRRLCVLQYYISLESSQDGGVLSTKPPMMHSGASPSTVPCDSAPLALRLFGGLLLDIKRKIPFYVSDFKDGCSLQCVASFLFLYCACMSPVITFGGLLGEATEGRIVSTHAHADTHTLTHTHTHTRAHTHTHLHLQTSNYTHMGQ